MVLRCQAEMEVPYPEAMLDLKALPGMATPWGAVIDIDDVLCNGIVVVQLANEVQAFKVHEEWNERIPLNWRIKSGWYDSISQWTAIAVSFPNLFKPHHRQLAEGWRESVEVEVELDGRLCSKHCPDFRTDGGAHDHARIRMYFNALGYRVGAVTIL